MSNKHMTNEDILKITRAQLAIDLNCAPDDFDRDGFVFCVAKENIGRRPFPREAQHFDMLTMGHAVILSATAELLEQVKSNLEGKERDEAFSLPFVYGQGMFFVPDATRIKHLPLPSGFTLEVVEQKDLAPLFALDRFPHGIANDLSHPRPDILAFVAKHENEIVAVAGVSNDCATMWQVGIDVLPAYRGKGLATALVSELTQEVLLRGIVPYYAASTCNVASQRVAYSAGYALSWMQVYRGRFGDLLTLPNC